MKRTIIFGIALVSLILSACSRDEPAVNNPVTPPPVQTVSVVINEIMSTGSPDWVELYNPNDQTVDISGYFAYDPSTVDNKFVVPAGTTIPAKGFLVLYCDDTNTGLHTNFKLSSGGEDVTIEDATGVLVDTITFPALTSGSSFCRIPDGSTNWQTSATPTEGTANQ